ncbi:MAG: hypothetical protein N2234_08570, partial [Planctomycetota bacterium]|nr:hypothetical protein [Planctomycetota bacterium]
MEESVRSEKEIRCAERRLKRNYILGIVNGVMFRASEPFIDLNTIIPVFIGMLTPSQFFVGLATGLRLAGWHLPQFFIANTVAAQEKKHPTYISFGFFRLSSIAAIPLVVWLVGSYNASLLLGLFILFWAAYYFSGGLCGVSFVDVVAKTIPAERLSRFWAIRLFLGGAFAVGSGFVVKKVQGAYEFPYEFVVIFGIAAAMAAGAIIPWFFALEQRDKIVRPKKTLKEHLAENIAIFRNDTQFRALFLFRSFLVFWVTCVPYFIVFANRWLEVDVKSYLGYFVASQTFGALTSNLVWVYMSERLGESRGILM